MSRPSPLVVLVATVLLLHGCFFMPHVAEGDDPACRTVTRRLVLKKEQVGTLGCTGDGCLGTLVAMGVVAGGSLVVSGSVVLVGNVVYWIEKQGRCQAPADGTTIWNADPG